MATPLLAAVDAATPLAAALAYAAVGWRVVPIGRGSKAPRIRAWNTAGSTNPDTIRAWWTDDPDCGVGIVCGPSSGIFVVDVDEHGPISGADTLADLQATYGRLPECPTVITGGGGLHLYFAYPPGTMITNDAGRRLGPGLDVRAEGGQVVAPPSRHPNGRLYEWEASSLPALDLIEQAAGRLVPPSAPVWLVELLTARPARQPPVEAPKARSGRPGDDWEATKGWPELLGASGATYLGERIDHRTGTSYQLWARPGVDHPSATVGYGGSDVLKVFTTNWEGLDPDATYTRFGFYAAMNHAGDHAAAARALAQQGYGSPSLDSLAASGAVPGSRGPTTPAPGATMRLVAAASIRIDRARWVWNQRIPIGGVTLMAGREGMGKTAFACWAAAQLTAGRLPGEWHGEHRSVVYVGHEDDRSSVLVPRLTAAGADLDRFQFVDIDTRAFTVAQDVDELAAALADLSVGLVVIDPLDSHLGAGIDTHKKAEVQATIEALARLAQKLRCGVLGIGHLNKAPIRDLLAKVVGSVGFTTSVRSVLAVGEHPEIETEAICVVAKANMTDRHAVPAIHFRVVEGLVPHPDGGIAITTARVEIVREQQGIRPDAVLGASAEDRSEFQHAQMVIRGNLSGGAHMRSRDLAEAAREIYGVSARTLHRARKSLGVEAYQKDREWWLRIPGADGQPPQVAKSGEWQAEGVGNLNPADWQPDSDGQTTQAAIRGIWQPEPTDDASAQLTPHESQVVNPSSLGNLTDDQLDAEASRDGHDIFVAGDPTATERDQ
jgi:hypothetical protein